MPSVTLDDVEWQYILNLMFQASGPGISMATTQPIVVKIAAQLPKPASGQSVRPIKFDGREGKRQ